MPRPIHFEIHADNPERAIAFYSGCFGWTFSRWEGGQWPYWLVTTGQDGPGINGGLLPRMGASPVVGQAVNSFVCTLGVHAVDESMRTVESNGGKMVVPKMAIPGIGWLTYATDTEGNIFGMMQEDESAR
jgi:predicted enzyme related to lactoylglutathione lyase